jgi:ABC-type multidrug transport system ATPase subunit
MSPAISTRDLLVRFGDTVVIDGITIDVVAGSVVGVLGPNGAGKTTLVRVLATQLAPSDGRAWISGYDVAAERREVQRCIGQSRHHSARPIPGRFIPSTARV